MGEKSEGCDQPYLRRENEAGEGGGDKITSRGNCYLIGVAAVRLV